MKTRLDQLLLARRLARSRAQALILAALAILSQPAQPKKVVWGKFN